MKLDAVRSLDKVTRATILGIFAVSIGNFAVAPILALALSVHEHLGPFQIGVILTVLGVSQQALTFFFGVAGDRFGARIVILAGLGARIAGYSVMAVSTRYLMFVAAAALIGIGGALFTPASKAIIAIRAVGPAGRRDAFALRSLALNTGAAIGPLLGALLFPVFRLALLLAAATYVGLLLVYLPLHFDEPLASIRPSIRTLTLSPFRDRRLVRLTICTVGFWALYTQFTLSVPLYVRETLHAGGAVALLFTVNAIVVIALQVVVLKWASRTLSEQGTLSVGAAVVGVAFCLLALPPSLPVFVLFTLVFSVGELLVVPTVDSLTSSLASGGATASYLGFVALGWGAGSLLGNLGGGSAFQLAERAGKATLLWIVCAAVGFATAVAFMRKSIG